MRGPTEGAGLEGETVQTLIEMKEKLLRAADLVWQQRLDDQGETRDDILRVHQHTVEVIGLIESILARGR